MSELGVVEAVAALRGGELTARELAESCLQRIEERDGTRSFDGDPASVNAWVRVYPEHAIAAAEQADERLARGDAPLLCGVPIGLKDLYAVAGKPLTASSRLLDEVPERSCDVWSRLEAAGMVLLGHLHTHEFAAGGTTDQVGNPWSLGLSAGGSSGGSAAALAAGMTPAATGTDTAGSLRIPSAMCGTSTIKPTHGTVSIRGIVPLGPTLDHAGPMARTVADCEPLLAAMAGVEPPRERRPLRRFAVSPRLVELDPDVAGAFDAVCVELDARPYAAPAFDDPGLAFLDVTCTGMLPYHRTFDGRRDEYRPSIRGFLEYAEERALAAEEYVAIQERRAAGREAWLDWFDEHGIDAILEPTVPIVAHARGTGYDEAFTDAAEISLTHQWNWTGFPVVSLPAGLGTQSGLPTSVSLIGRPGDDWDLLAAGVALQRTLGVVSPAYGR